MSTRTRRGITLVEVIVVLFVVGLLVALFIPRIGGAGEAANRNTCLNKLRQIALALENYESGKREYPLASWNKVPTFNALASTPACHSGTTTTGYSWIVSILPQLEEKSLYDSIKKKSSDFTID